MSLSFNDSCEASLISLPLLLRSRVVTLLIKDCGMCAAHADTLDISLAVYVAQIRPFRSLSVRVRSVVQYFLQILGIKVKSVLLSGSSLSVLVD